MNFHRKIFILIWLALNLPGLALPEEGLEGFIPLGTFSWKGEDYQTAQARMSNGNTIEIVHEAGIFRIPWNDAPASLQFQLKSEREDLLNKTPVQSPPAKESPSPKIQQRAAAQTSRDPKEQLRKIALDYETNTIAADQAYKNKLVEISVQVTYVERDLLGNPFLAFKEGAAYFDKSWESQLADIRAGEWVKIRATCQGKGLAGIVFFDSMLME